MSFFSECVRSSGSCEFRIPYDRQQLADYLGVDRSALSGELSKMRKEGLLEYEKNWFHQVGGVISFLGEKKARTLLFEGASGSC